MSRNTAQSRLMNEFRDICRSSLNTCTSIKDVILIPKGQSSLFSWVAFIKGPTESPYDKGVFELSFSVPTNYPLSPPKVIFITKIFHPNIHFRDGNICLDVLKTEWTPIWSLETICRAIISLLAHPEPESPLNCDAGNLLRCGDTRGFNSMARMYVEECALTDNMAINRIHDLSNGIDWESKTQRS